MSDSVLDGFLETAAEDAVALNAASDILLLEADAAGNGAPHTYTGWLREVEHFERCAAGTVAVSAAAVKFTVHFPADYCRSVDPQLQFRVARVHGALVHPNCRGGVVCLGPHFRPGTRLRPLVEQLYGMIAARVFATNHAFDAEAARYYLQHLDEVRALKAPPLWRRRLAGSIRVERGTGTRAARPGGEP